jgi:Initiator Replication protein
LIFEEKRMTQNKRVFPTGNLMSERNKVPITAPVPLPIVFSQIYGKFTAIDRKLWLMLLHVEWDNLLTKSKVGEWHEIKEQDLIQLFAKYSGSKDLDKIWESGKRLSQTTVEYIKVENDERWEGITSLFHCEYKRKDRREGIFRFMFPAPLIPILLEPGRFARLRIEFLLRLDSKYAITLYQILETVANLRQPFLKASLEEIREWLKVPEDKLKTWAHFYNNALKPAVDEINSNPELSGFTVAHEFVRGGKGGKVIGVNFTVQKTSFRIGFENSLKLSPRARENKTSDSLLPPFRGTKIYEKAKKKAPGLDVYVLEKEWREWVRDKNVEVRNAEALFLHFCEQRATKTRVHLPT